MTTMRLLSPEDPAAEAIVAMIVAGDVAGLKRLLDEHPGIAQDRIGDASCSRSMLHVVTDWPGHFPNAATTVDVLVAGGADPDARYIGRAHRETPLHWAASSNDVDVLAALLRAGADIDADGGVMVGGTPLEDARIFAQWDAARLLVEHGASTSAEDEAALGLLDRLSTRRLTAGPELDQAFWYACHGGQRAAAEHLLDAGADLDWVPPWEPLTPLDAAIRSHAENGTRAEGLIGWLRERGARQRSR